MEYPITYYPSIDSHRQLGTSYVLATGGALVTALGLNSLVKVGTLFSFCVKDLNLGTIKKYIKFYKI